jgi:putative ABC transport system permease protein
MFYIFLSLALNKGVSNMIYAGYVKIMLLVGVFIIGIFSTIFLFYTNQFLMKQRKKELGLYAVLGLEKRHIAKLLWWENSIGAMLTLGIGIFLGVLFSRLFFLLLLKLLGFPIAVGFEVSFKSMGITMIVFAVIYFLIFVGNIISASRVSPVELLKEGNKGEKEPKASWILALIGWVTLAGGYGVAQRVAHPIDALTLFFPAVLLVILATYSLFSAGSIKILKSLKKRKEFYYHPNHFAVISGMIYRMKQNAMGLANICILSTMLLVTVSTTIALYIGQESILREKYPYDIVLNGFHENIEEEKIEDKLAQMIKPYALEVVDKKAYRVYETVARIEGNKLSPMADSQSMEKFRNAYSFYMLLLEDYNRLASQNQILEESEVLLYQKDKKNTQTELMIGQDKYHIKENIQGAIDQIQLYESQMKAMGEPYILVVKDEKELLAIADVLGEGVGTFPIRYQMTFNLKGDTEEATSFAASFTSAIREETGINRVQSMHLEKNEINGIYGSFLFMGIFMGILFMMATTLIIYFKQISEGYEDRSRIEIMQKVGMSKKEVSTMIHRQILMVFFIPLLTSLLHTGFAFKMIKTLLGGVFGLTNVNLILICTVGVSVVFAVVYTLVYKKTAKVYYEMIE